MEGILYKWTNYFSGWQQRWFILKDGVLSYYRSPEEVNNGCKGSVKLSVCDLIVHSVDPTRLDLAIPGEQRYYLKTVTQQERQCWIIALGSCKACLASDCQQQVIKSKDEIASEAIGVKRSEMRLYRDLLMQQASSLKALMAEGSIPDVQVQTTTMDPNCCRIRQIQTTRDTDVDEMTGLMNAACNAFLTALDECMCLLNAQQPTGPLLFSSVKSPPGNSASATPGSRRLSGYQAITSSAINNSGGIPAVSGLGHPTVVTMPTSTACQMSPSSQFGPGTITTSSPHRAAGVEEALWHPPVTPIEADSDRRWPPIRPRTPRHRRERHTFFSSMPASFEDIRLEDVDEGIPTVQFLEASRSIVTFFDVLNSTAFAPVKLDLASNIKKLHVKYATQPAKFDTIQAIVNAEMKLGQHGDSNSATVAVLWLNRGLMFFREFINELVSAELDQSALLPLEDSPPLIRNSNNNNTTNSACQSDDMCCIATAAYNRTLRPYHNWVVRGVFALAARALPYRSQFFRALLTQHQYYQPAANHNAAETDLIETSISATSRHQLRIDMENYGKALGRITQILVQFYARTGLSQFFEPNSVVVASS